MALSYYAVSPYGLETLLADELHRLGAQRIHPQKGGVLFEGDAALGMAACLHSRLASRILLRVAHGKYWDSRDIYKMALETPWEKWFGPDHTIRVSANAQRCPLESIDFAVLRIKDAVCDRFREMAGRRPSVERHSPDVRIAAFLTYDTVTFYLDRVYEVKYLAFNLGNWRSGDYYRENHRPQRLTITMNGRETQVDFPDEKTKQWVAVEEGCDTSLITITIEDVYYGSNPDWDDTCIAEVEIYGEDAD